MDRAVTDRRRALRLPASVLPTPAARLRPGRDVVLVDISDGGALIDARTRLLPGSAVVLQLQLRHQTVTLRGRVVRCEVVSINPTRGVRYRGGISFDETQRIPSEAWTRCG